MYRTFFRHLASAVIAIACLIGLFPAAVSALGELAGQTKSASDAGPLDQQTLREVQALSQRLIEAENRKDFDAVKQTVWNSPSALFVAKTATSAEGNWAGFWGHDVVVLRNHGFFVDAQGIRLSPAYDINPSIDRNELSLAIDETESTCDISVAMNAHKTYGISAAQAASALKSVETAVGTWRTEATRFGIPRAELDLMAVAFE